MPAAIGRAEQTRPGHALPFQIRDGRRSRSRPFCAFAVGLYAVGNVLHGLESYAFSQFLPYAIIDRIAKMGRIFGSKLGMNSRGVVILLVGLVISVAPTFKTPSAAEETLKEAKESFEGYRYAETIEQLRPFAEAGVPDAQFLMGELRRSSSLRCYFSRSIPAASACSVSKPLGAPVTVPVIFLLEW